MDYLHIITLKTQNRSLRFMRSINAQSSRARLGHMSSVDYKGNCPDHVSSMEERSTVTLDNSDSLNHLCSLIPPFILLCIYGRSGPPKNNSCPVNIVFVSLQTQSKVSEFDSRVKSSPLSKAEIRARYKAVLQPACTYNSIYLSYFLYSFCIQKIQ